MIFRIWLNYLKERKSLIVLKGNIERYKSHIVAEAFGQKEGVDYKDTPFCNDL